MQRIRYLAGKLHAAVVSKLHVNQFQSRNGSTLAKEAKYAFI